MGARRAAVGALAFLGAVAAGCEPEGDRLPTSTLARHGVRGAASLAVDEGGRIWVGGRGGAVALDSTGARLMTLRIGGADAPELAGSAAGVVHFRAGDSLVAVDRAGERTGGRDGFSGVPLLHDPRGRFVAQGARSGAVLAFDPATLDPLLGWASLDAPTTALAVAPEGDVLWQAVRRDGDAAILVRDVQTGRTFAEIQLPSSVLTMLATPEGDLITAGGDGERIQVARLRPRAGEAERTWSVGLRLSGSGAPALRYSPAAGRVAVLCPGSESGLRVLDAEAGAQIGSLEETPLDAAFTPAGELYLLYPDEIRRVEGRRR